MTYKERKNRNARAYYLRNREEIIKRHIKWRIENDYKSPNKKANNKRYWDKHKAVINKRRRIKRKVK